MRGGRSPWRGRGWAAGDGEGKRCGSARRRPTRTYVCGDARNFLVNAHVKRHVVYALRAPRIPRAAPHEGAPRRGAARRAWGEHETMKNARAAIYYLRVVQVTTAERETERGRAGSISPFSPPPPPRSPAPLFSSPNPGFPLRLVSLMRPPLARSSGKQRASGLLNNSLCGLTERERERERKRCVCTCIDARLFREIASLGGIIPLVSRVLRRRRRYSAAILLFFPRGETTGGGGRGLSRWPRETPKSDSPDAAISTDTDFNGSKHGFGRSRVKLPDVERGDVIAAA